MESGLFARGREEVPAEASVVLVGNTIWPDSALVHAAQRFAGWRLSRHAAAGRPNLADDWMAEHDGLRLTACADRL